MTLCVKIAGQGCLQKDAKCEQLAEFEIPAALEVGQKVSYIGTPERDAEEFCVYLVNKQGDVALSVQVDFEKNIVTLDYKCSDASARSHQLTFDDTSLPFSRGIPFKLGIEVLKDEYKLSVTGQHLAYLNHRVQPTTVTTMKVKGDVKTKELRLG